MPAILLSIIASRIGQIGLAFVVGWAMAWWKTDTSWRETIAKERAAAESAIKIERARQELAAREIVVEAAKRLAEEQEITAAMQQQIDDLKRSEAHVTKPDCTSCRVDDDFIKRMRDIDVAGRKAKPARRPR